MYQHFFRQFLKQLFKMLFSILILVIYVQLFLNNFVQGALLNKNNNFIIEEATIDYIHSLIISKKATCEEIINSYLDRIKEYNLAVTNAPPFNAISQINPYLIDIARDIDKIYANNKRLIGPLHCIPVILKDNIDSYDTNTSAGSFSLLGNQPIQDAFLVSKLRDSGAVLIGKGAMDEFAMGIFGISSRNGRIGNVYNTYKNSGGSSGGIAVAVSANFAVLGIGTDNDGSIRIPAAFNGVIGLRPSTGLISRTGIFPIGNLDAVPGPIARTTKDLAIILDVISKPDPQDKNSLIAPRIKSYMNYLNKNGLKNKRIGIVHKVNNRDFFKEMPEDAIMVIKNALQLMKKSGAILIDNIAITDFNTDRTKNQVGEIEEIDKYLATFPASRKNFRDICESKRTSVFGTKENCLNFIKSTPKKFTSKYYQALKIFRRNKNYIEKKMDEYNVDVLLMPITTNGTANYDSHIIVPIPVASNSGLPSITINAGYNATDNLPIGLELIGRQFHEKTLIEISYAYEQNFPIRVIPQMPKPKISLTKLSIPQINNLFNTLGKASYDKILQYDTPDQLKLTPHLFKDIFIEQTTLYINNLNKQ